MAAGGVQRGSRPTTTIGTFARQEGKAATKQQQQQQRSAEDKDHRAQRHIEATGKTCHKIGGRKKVGGGGEIPEGCKVERRGCCRRSGAEEGRDGGKKGKERSRASTPSQSYTPFPQSPPTGVSALVRARGDRRTSAQHGPVGTRTRTHAKHRNNTSEPKVLNKLWTTGGGKKRRKKKRTKSYQKKSRWKLAARRPPPAAARSLRAAGKNGHGFAKNIRKRRDSKKHT